MELSNSMFNFFIPLKKGFTLEDYKDNHFQLFNCSSEDLQLYILQMFYKNIHLSQTFIDAVWPTCEIIMNDFKSRIADEFWDLSVFCNNALEEIGRYGIILNQNELLEKTFANFVTDLVTINLSHLLYFKAINTMKWSQKLLTVNDLNILTTCFSMEDNMQSFCTLLHSMLGLRGGFPEESDHEME